MHPNYGPIQRPRVHFLLLLAAILITQLATPAAYASDPVVDWIAITNDIVIQTGTNPLLTSRILSLLSGSVFDSVNGIEPRYRSLHVRPGAPRNSSAKAAAIQSAYVILTKFYPTMTASLTSQRNLSLASLHSSESLESIHEGVRWGQSVADAMWEFRLNDGFAPPPPPFVGVLGIAGSSAAVGVWRPTPPANAFAVGSQIATMTPWVLKRASQLRLPPPYTLTSAEYAADYNETKSMGIASGSPRTADQSELVLFWDGNVPLGQDRCSDRRRAVVKPV